jgi:xylulokinase
VPTGFTASKLVWLQRHEPERWAKVRHVLLPHDYVNFLAHWRGLDGVRRCVGHRLLRPGDAPVRPPGDGMRSTRVCRAAAAAAAPGALAGRLSASRANLLGPEGLPVATGGGDNMMSAIGSGATRAGVVVVSLGTSGTIFTRTEAPVVDPQGLDRAVLQQRRRLVAVVVRDEPHGRHRRSARPHRP